MNSWLLKFPVAAILIGAGILKAADPVPVSTGQWYDGGNITAVLPWAEIGAGLLLFSDLPTCWTAWPAVALCAAFVVVSLGQLAAVGPVPSCGCFGVIPAPQDHWHAVAVVILFLAACVMPWADRRDRRSRTTICP